MGALKLLTSSAERQKLWVSMTRWLFPSGEDEISVWDFLEVHNIYRNARNGITLRGLRLARQHRLNGILPRTVNEVCALLDVDDSDERPDIIQGAAEIDDIQDESLRVSDEHTRNAFRGGIIRGGSYTPGQANIPSVIVHGDGSDDADDGTGHAVPPRAARHPEQKYTVDDMFCGARGASSGIRQANFHLQLACDNNPEACQTYALNFPGVDLRAVNIFDLIDDLDGDASIGSEESSLSSSSRRRKRSRKKEHADLLHISPPCQVYSPAHTVAGRDDDANVAALHATGCVLARRRPRLSTGEETFGLLFARNADYWRALARQYTGLGYSLRWDVADLRAYGLAQTRKRLLWIAACPGEELPPGFPPPTHESGRAGSGGGGVVYPKRLRPAVTVGDVLATVPSRGVPNHDWGSMTKEKDRDKVKARKRDANAPTGTITCSGDVWHPSGKRRFTVRELAALQGFPNDHEFRGVMTKQRKQVGNAFPPVVVKVLYRYLEGWLLKQDNIYRPVTVVTLSSSSSSDDSDDDENGDSDVLFVRKAVRGARVRGLRQRRERELRQRRDRELWQRRDLELRQRRERRAAQRVAAAGRGRAKPIYIDDGDDDDNNNGGLFDPIEIDDDDDDNSNNGFLARPIEIDDDNDRGLVESIEVDDDNDDDDNNNNSNGNQANPMEIGNDEEEALAQPIEISDDEMALTQTIEISDSTDDADDEDDDVTMRQASRESSCTLV
ncbi:S-adenosyl-L-methionine-dependent methyltransferase [Xylariaceae sp. FL0804]|nr:S-adenosyl-L-methionine-dependent methyltransferase [Xylariaceae sp. FL0804]